MNWVNDYDNFDGPTSAYVKRNRKTSFAYKFKKMLYERKKAEVEKSISFDDIMQLRKYVSMFRNNGDLRKLTEILLNINSCISR